MRHLPTQPTTAAIMIRLLAAAACLLDQQHNYSRHPVTVGCSGAREFATSSSEIITIIITVKCVRVCLCEKVPCSQMDKLKTILKLPSMLSFAKYM
ncbi:unnamed protein product [Ceratitis capitata]|uniref:(Mediterranean fruit fly) hypothetical protein n=1 Tax=Ceratitis capitata TaxID=7213 RepID=A0A811UGV2_CERCA|nr:unnamed protein product [Ceratitis capitata]